MDQAGVRPGRVIVGAPLAVAQNAKGKFAKGKNVVDSASFKEKIIFVVKKNRLSA